MPSGKASTLLPTGGTYTWYVSLTVVKYTDKRRREHTGLQLMWQGTPVVKPPGGHKTLYKNLPECLQIMRQIVNGYNMKYGHTVITIELTDQNKKVWKFE